MASICVISDIHGQLAYLHKLREFMEAQNCADLIMLGDYSRTIGSLEENRDDIRAIMNPLADRASLYALPGNCDAREVPAILKGAGIFAHNCAVTAGGYTVISYGGSNPTPFETPWEIDEEVIYRDLKGLFAAHESGRKILAVHAPPRDTKCDVIPSGAHVGSVAIRRIIEEFAPAVVVCGHIHECAGRRDTIGASIVLNVGRLADGHCARITPDGVEYCTL
ncbi:MAG: metallophosphoesterase [Planctomycetota bacterium]